MNLHALLTDHASEILVHAMDSVQRAHLTNYEKEGTEHTRERLKALFTLTARGVKERNLAPMRAHAETIARERYAAGYDLGEVQTAFNVLEEAIWKVILAHVAPGDLAEALGLVSTVLGAGKDTLAQMYVSLASKSHAPSLNLTSLFTGS